MVLLNTIGIKIAYEILSINSIDGIGESIAYGILCINSNDAIEESISLTKASYLEHYLNAALRLALIMEIKLKIWHLKFLS